MSSIQSISGVFPHLAVKGEHLPKRTEVGIGALMPWANRLWFVNYVAHKAESGGGTGLFYIDDQMAMTRHPDSRVGTYANRMIHRHSNQLFIGPHLIDTNGNVRTIDALVSYRLAAVCEHLANPEKFVYVLGMEGEFFEVNVYTLEVTKLFDLTKTLADGSGTISRPHFKDAYTAHGRVVVVNNSYYESDFIRGFSDGRLAEWDGKTWQILERTQFNTVTGRLAGDMGEAIYAVGQDRASAILQIYLPSTGWKRYRLPKGTHTHDHAWTTEWPRIREVESERWLMDASGLIYEMAAMTYDGAIWGIKPVCSHLRIIGDYCSWNGMLVMAGDQTTPIGDANTYVGQPQANLWFGKTDDLWSWGKPTGWGGPWWLSPVKAGTPSDPYLMTGFENKCLHLSHDAETAVKFTIEVDFMGTGQWHRYLVLEAPAGGYAFHSFPVGYSVHWVRIIADHDCHATAQFHYT